MPTKAEQRTSIEIQSDGPPETSITVCQRVSESAAERGRGNEDGQPRVENR